MARHRGGGAPRGIVEDVEHGVMIGGADSGGGEGGGELRERCGTHESGYGFGVVQQLLLERGGSGGGRGGEGGPLLPVRFNR